MSTQGQVSSISFHWHLRSIMAQRKMFATSDLVPLLADRGVKLSREQVYRLVTGTPKRLNLMTLSALCDILGCSPTDLVEPICDGSSAPVASKPSARVGTLTIPPKRANIISEIKSEFS